MRRNLKNLLWGSKRRRVVVGSLVALGLAGAATAFYLILVGATGSGSGTLGTTSPGSASKATLTSVVLPAGLMPGQSGPISATINNPNSFAVSVDPAYLAAHANVANLADGCSWNWFPYSPPSAPITVPANSSVTGANIGSLAFTDTGNDQSMCSGQTITLSFL